MMIRNRSTCLCTDRTAEERPVSPDAHRGRTSRICDLLVLAILSCVLTLAGCNGSAPDVKPDATTQADKNQETEGEKCRKKLAAAIQRVTPEDLVLQSRPERAVNGLNAWIASCASEELKELEVSENALKLVGSNPRATARRFTANDAGYLRDCLLLRDLSTAIWERTDVGDTSIGKDQHRTIQLFSWICRNISLMPASEKRVTLGLFDVLLTGRGTAEDRAWVFVEALRQQHIHAAFVVTTDEKPGEGADRLAQAVLLVAVKAEDSSLLFDPVGGNMVTALDSSRPATISDLKNHPRWMSSKPGVVAQLSAFSPRMLVLQNQLAAEDAAVFFEELTGDTSDITSLLDLAEQLGGGFWSKDQVGIWRYPEERTVAAASLSEDQTQQYTQLMQSFNAPFERDVYPTKSVEELTTVPEELSEEDRKALVQQRLMENFIRMQQSSEEKFGKPSKRLLKVRIRQILGDTDTGVIQQLQQIRIASMQEQIKVAVPEEVQRQFGLPAVISIEFPELIREVNLSSTGDSLYWTGLCQIDRGEAGAAITTLKNYRRQYPNGKWHYPSLMNQAMALQMQDRADDAKTLLGEADDPENPERAMVQLMLSQLGVK